MASTVKSYVFVSFRDFLYWQIPYGVPLDTISRPFISILYGHEMDIFAVNKFSIFYGYG